MKKNVYIIIDGMSGDCGKGKVYSEFALEEKPELAIINHMPNADHSAVVNGKKRIFRHIPVSSVNKDTELFLGPNVFINMDILEKEYYDNLDLLDGRDIYAHPNIALIEQRHIDYEKNVLKKSGSTFSGGGACAREKIMRSFELSFFKGYKGIKVLSYDEYYAKLRKHLENSKKILLEGSQGCDLDINHSGHYPNTTSKQVAVTQMLADAGISFKHVKEVGMIIRPYPIRVAPGNVGNSKEISWKKVNIDSVLGPGAYEDVGENSGYEVVDYTEVIPKNGEVKRVFEGIDIKQLQRNIQINTPDYLYLNFFQHLDYEYEGIKGIYNGMSNNIYLTKPLREYIYWIEDNVGVKVRYLGTGAEAGEKVRIKK